MKKKKAVKRSGSRAASVAGRWMNMGQDKRKLKVMKIVGSYLLGWPRRLNEFIDDIDTLAASVLSQREKDGE